MAITQDGFNTPPYVGPSDKEKTAENVAKREGRWIFYSCVITALSAFAIFIWLLFRL